MRKWFVAACSGLFFLTACKQKLAEAPVADSREAQVQKNLADLKTQAMPGDLVVRLGDDLLSYQIKFMNDSEKLYSHAGIIVQEGAQKLIVHITPDEEARDGIQYTPIDSFLAPAKNLSCALYRFDFTPAERDSFMAIIVRYKEQHLRFDRLYDLRTDTAMYCSEMISKAANLATRGRIKFRQTDIPPKLIPALYRFFKKQATVETIAQRKVMTIDNLYRIPQCKLITRFQLKYLPGQ